MTGIETTVIAERLDLRDFAAAVREMIYAQRAARKPGAIVHERHIAQHHEQHVKQWIRVITQEELTEESETEPDYEGRAAA